MKRPTISTSKLRNSARGEHCTLLLYPHCKHDSDTVVLAHIGQNSGMGRKSSDLSAVYCCHHCHDVIDGRVKTKLTKLDIAEAKIRGLERTHLRMIAKGLLVVDK